MYDNDRVNGESAEVDTRVVGGAGAPIKIDYKLHRTREEWIRNSGGERDRTEAGHLPA